MRLTGQPWHGVAAGEISNRQTLHPGPKKFRSVEPLNGRWCLLADIFCVDQDMTRQCVLDPKLQLCS